MPEGLSASEIGRELDGHARHAAERGEALLHRHERVLTILEAVLLSLVTITAAWSGYSAAKWSSKSDLELAKAATASTQANRAYQESLTLRAADASKFNAWFVAYLSGKQSEQRVAERRFRPEYDVAFRAWLAEHPFTNPKAPSDPEYMSQYVPTGTLESVRLDLQSEALTAKGEHSASVSDDYIRVTVILASVLFLVGVSSHMPMRGVRIGLVGVGIVMLIVAAVSILQLPGPPA
jgi:hypothetical protein